MGSQVKNLPSQLDEVGAVLSEIRNPLHSQVPGVTVFQQLSSSSPLTTSLHDASSCTGLSASILDWSALPAAVDADSMPLGVSTRKKTAKQQAKQRPADEDKVKARAARKRAQVESFVLCLQPLLQATGHAAAAAAAAQPAIPPGEMQGSCRTCQKTEKQQAHPQKQQQESSPGRQEQSQLLPNSVLEQQACSSHSQQQPTGTPVMLPLQQQQQLSHHPTQLHIVDFGCGTGNLLLPLAALLPYCRFTGVDMKPAALQLLQQRAAAAGLANVSVFAGMIEQYREPFDVALALHACGNATDHVLQMAVDQGAAFVVSPCCVGKLRFSMTGGSSFHSTPLMWTPTQPGDRPVQQAHTQQHEQPPIPPLQQQQYRQQSRQQEQLQPPADKQPQQQEGAPDAGVPGVPPKLRHPRSDWLTALLPDPEKHFRIMAKVADSSHAPADRAELVEALASRAAVADTCKRFVELDRCAAAAEAGYAVGLFKVLQADTMAKNDLLVGMPLTSYGEGQPRSRTAEHCDACIGGRVQKCLRECGKALADRGILYTSSTLVG